MPHQQHVADVGLEIDPVTGELAYSQVIVIGPRQVTGKTELVLPVLTHRCVGFDRALAGWVRRELGVPVEVPDPQRVMYTSQTADKARARWRDVHVKRLERSAYRRRFTVRRQRNFEAIIWNNDATWCPEATTSKTGGTGDSVDLAVVDEAWSRPDNRTELGLRPAMMTRWSRQLWVLSMIPGLSRCRPGEWPYLAAKRLQGRARVEAGSTSGVAFFDFTAPEGWDPGDPVTWRACMPGLGRTVSERTVRDDFESGMPLVDFCAEYLGWEPMETMPRWTLLPQIVWDERYDPGSQIVGVPALAVEFSDDREQAWIGAAGWREDGHYHVELVEPGGQVPDTIRGVDWVQRRLVELVESHRPCATVIGRSRPAGSLVVPLRNRGVEVLTPGLGDVAGACGRFFDATGAHRPGSDGDVDPGPDDGLRVHHLGQPSLDRAMASARRYDLGGGAFVFVGKGAPAAVLPLNVVVLALHGLLVVGAPAPEPDIFV
jgi:hypothetical protein